MSNVINISGVIGGAYDWWTSDKTRGTTADQVRAGLLSAGAKADVEIRIQSVGGDVKEALEIYDLLAKHKGLKTVVVDRLAAGAAALIAMAGDKIIMSPAATLMIGSPYYVSLPEPYFDPRHEMLAMNQAMVSVYRKNNPGLSEAEVSDILDRETWYTAAAAKAAGWCDEIIEASELKAA